MFQVSVSAAGGPRPLVVQFIVAPNTRHVLYWTTGGTRPPVVQFIVAPSTRIVLYWTTGGTMPPVVQFIVAPVTKSVALLCVHWCRGLCAVLQ